MDLRQLALIALGIAGMVQPLQGYAETVAGSQSKELRSKCKNERPRSTEEFNEVLAQAKTNALRTWAARKSVATSALFDENEEKILANIDDYFLNAQVDYSCDKKSFRLKVKGLVDVNKLGLLGKAAPGQFSAPRSRMTAVFLARKAKRVKSFDQKRTTIDEKTSFNEGAESVATGGNSASIEGYSNTKNVQVSGGSAIVRADNVEWVVSRAGPLDAAVNETFSSFGFRLIDVSQVASRFPGFDLGAFQQDFAFGDDLSPATKNDAFDAIAGKIPLLVIATVDLGQKDIDPSSGLQRVYATVSGQVYNDDGLFFNTIAAVRPTQLFGLGPNETVAETNALVAAAEAASQEIVQQLNAAGIK